MKISKSLHVIAGSFILLLMFSFPVQSRVEGTLSQLFFKNDGATLELVVHREDLEKIVSVAAGPSENTGSILQKIDSNRDEVLSFLGNHISMHAGGKKWPMKLRGFRFKKPFYFQFVLDWMWDAPPLFFELDYDYENNYDHKDEAVLILHDQTSIPEKTFYTLLHGSRKKAVWDRNTLRNEPEILTSESFWNLQTGILLISMMIALIFAMNMKKVLA
ncbi:MAG: hypothetical protein JW774_03800 [Candidatus Aureabacteria bacterium]|nr:hypothetical protein [Candidatus Auribacterota bacterium]